MRVPGDPGPALMRIPRASQSACKFRAPSSSPSAKVRSHFRSSASILDTLSAGGPSRPSTASQVWAPPERSCRPAASRFSMKTPDALSSQAMRSPVLKSLWMRAFFKEYLPRSFEHLSKKLKVANGGVVGFDLMRAQVPAYSASGHAAGMRTIYRIEPTSITEVYKGFAKSAPKSKTAKAKAA